LWRKPGVDIPGGFAGAGVVELGAPKADPNGGTVPDPNNPADATCFPDEGFIGVGVVELGAAKAVPDPNSPVVELGPRPAEPKPPVELEGGPNPLKALVGTRFWNIEGVFFGLTGFPALGGTDKLRI
jgi:hypothetical protein